ncbi:hypothetical protein M9Y10_037116 [Tritrichomonas musculus]|uniref:Uncharacterized protein n=1 Tax=Tritrichomonas musculus TaxID=1915356 RepID=A0ABR2GT06_9EUKA
MVPFDHGQNDDSDDCSFFLNSQSDSDDDLFEFKWEYENDEQEIQSFIAITQTKNCFSVKHKDSELKPSPNDLNNQLCDTQFEKSNGQKVTNPGNLHRNPKRIVDLSDPEKYFKNQYYKIFISGKKFQKKYVQQIHNRFLKNIEGFKKMKREEFRRIDIYFQNYATHQDQIFKVLKENKDVISKEILHL